MKRAMLVLATLISTSLLTSPACAHAFLKRAEPRVGSSIDASPAELRLDFTQGLVGEFCSISLIAPTGAKVPLSKPSLSPSDSAELTARVLQALPPGLYRVEWRVVSVDTHHTQGEFQFRIAR
ncbi:MAG: copper resistance CopC family protein [Caulobacteraceae bacterium]